MGSSLWVETDDCINNNNYDDCLDSDVSLAVDSDSDSDSDSVSDSVSYSVSDSDSAW